MSDTQTFETFVAKERDRLAKARAKILGQQAELQQQLAAIETEMRAVDAYEAVKSGKAAPATGTKTRKSGTRRSGIRDEILGIVSSAAGGITRGELLEKKGIIERDDKAGAQSVSNALAALKKAGKLSQNADGKYVAA
ncbi:MAG: hypothetical protein RLO06_16950 [Parvibaculum sp.]